MVVGFILKATNSFNYAYYAFAALTLVGGFLALVLLHQEKAVGIQRAGKAA